MREKYALFSAFEFILKSCTGRYGIYQSLLYTMFEQDVILQDLKFEKVKGTSKATFVDYKHE